MPFWDLHPLLYSVEVPSDPYFLKYVAGVEILCFIFIVFRNCTKVANFGEIVVT
jgi:hypothetical protein